MKVGTVKTLAFALHDFHLNLKFKTKFKAILAKYNFRDLNPSIVGMGTYGSAANTKRLNHKATELPLRIKPQQFLKI